MQITGDGWYRAAVTPAQFPSDFKSRLQKDFQSNYLRNGAPAGVAILVSKYLLPLSDAPHESALSHFIYFSRAAVKLFPTLLSEFNAAGCREPIKSEVSLLAGDDKVYDSLK